MNNGSNRERAALALSVLFGAGLLSCGASLDPGFETGLDVKGACDLPSQTYFNLYATDSEGSILVSVFEQSGVNTIADLPNGQEEIDFETRQATPDASLQPVVYLELGRHLDSLLCDQVGNGVKGAKTITRYQPLSGSLTLNALAQGDGFDVTATFDQVQWSKELHSAGSTKEQTMPHLVIGPVHLPAP